MSVALPRVALVGAGPGAPDLITVRGLRRLQAAAVVLHDRLVSPALIAEAPAGARCINVGKAPSRVRFPQAEIDRILVEEARAGHRVVRLRGGDPFVFGLGGQEALALAAAGIDFELIPGLSAATALPGLAGVPLTQGGVSAAITVLSGHYPPGHPRAADIARLPRDSTLVVLMGRRHMGAIVARLLETGWAPQTPALLIASGSTAEEVVRSAPLAGVAAQATALTAPLTLVVGATAGLRAQLAPWLRGPVARGRAWGRARPVASEQP